MELLAAILAGAIGTVAMTLSSGTEMHWTGRPESPAPGVAAVWPLKLIGVSVEGRSLMVVSTWAHWGYGSAWGVVWWLLIAQAELPLALAAVSFFAIVWVTAVLLLRITGIAPWPWKWGHIKYNIFDWTHHGAYVSGTVIGWVLIEQVAGGAI
ncbi:MAG: hypothetical protein IIC94_09585 [Chloroflexi bacterium]|nr:hypothetical protein [Chloroflexota bacterium]